jgi:hypothetical protein
MRHKFRAASFISGWERMPEISAILSDPAAKTSASLPALIPPIPTTGCGATGVLRYYGAVGHELRIAMARCHCGRQERTTRIERLAMDERIPVKEHPEGLVDRGLDFGKWKMIVIFNRGYPSKDVIKYLHDTGIRYVM